MPKMRYCFNCGEPIGESTYADPYDTCGKTECYRAVNDAIDAERAEAHEQLDRERGW